MAQSQTSNNSLSIVSIVWFKVLPPVFGGQKGIAHFNEHLGKRVRLCCLCSRDNELMPASYRVQPLLPAGKAQFVNPFCWYKIYQTCLRQKATHLVLEFPYHGIAGVLCKVLLRKKLVVHAHNVEALRFRQQKKWWWRILFFYEQWTLNNADAVFFKTENDRQIAINSYGLIPEATGIIPFGITQVKKPDKVWAKEVIGQRHGLGSKERILLFAGTLDYAPNAAAVTAIEKVLLPLLQAKSNAFRIIICGRIVLEEFAYIRQIRHPSMLYAGNVEDIETYFSAADVFLNPVAIGGGVQTKVIDALNFNLNVVCFDAMTQGIEKGRSKLFVAPQGDWQAFADQTLEALKADYPTPAEFFERHDWNKIAEKTVDHFCRL